MAQPFWAHSLTRLGRRRVLPRRRFIPLVEELEAKITPAAFVYTLDTDFDQGTLQNVNHDTPNNNQLQLNTATTPFPFINIAASARGTMIRINTTTGAIIGEYFTAPTGRSRNPSRTTVDQFGNCWITNRDEATQVNGVGPLKGSITRYALVIGGTRGNKIPDGMGGWTVSPDALGEYIENPSYSTAIDRDGDGLIRTSRGLGHVLPWTNAGGVDNDGGVDTAADEAIINYVRTAGTNARTIAVDANNDIWVGGLGNRTHEKILGSTGVPVPGTTFTKTQGGYGGLIDKNGILWSASGGIGPLRFDPSGPGGAGNLANFTLFGADHGDYGLGISPVNGNIWHSSISNNLRLYEFNSAGTVLQSFAQPFQAQGVAVDGNGHVWMAELFGSRVWHLAPNPALPGTHIPVGIVSGFAGVTGLAVDAAGKVWASEINSSLTRGAARINPNAGPIGAGGYNVGAIDLAVGLNYSVAVPGVSSHAGPYNYSDMTGFVSIGATSPQGTWTETIDSGTAGTDWSQVAWNTEGGSIPPNGAIIVKARAAATQAGLASQTFVTLTNGADPGLIGQWIEVQVTLEDGDGGASPVFTDIKIMSAEAYQLNDIDVQLGQNQRSYVRYLDLNFQAGGDLEALKASGRIKLTHYNLDGTGGTNVPILASMMTVMGNTIRIDFGVHGIGNGTTAANRNTTAGDGHYKVSVDGVANSDKYFYRMLGDMNHDRKVDAADNAQIVAAYGAMYSAENDANGDGVVNSLDNTLALRSRGKMLGSLLQDDDPT